MTLAEAQLVLGLIPIAEQLVSKIATAIDHQGDTDNITLGELKAKLEATASKNWPDLQFKSPQA